MKKRFVLVMSWTALVLSVFTHPDIGRERTFATQNGTLSETPQESAMLPDDIGSPTEVVPIPNYVPGTAEVIPIPTELPENTFKLVK